MKIFVNYCGNFKTLLRCEIQHCININERLAYGAQFFMDGFINIYLRSNSILS